jgi:large repetitive protein
MGSTTGRARRGRFAAWLAGLALAAGVQAQGLPGQAWPAGTALASWEHGGRITTFHRGLLYLGGTDNQDTWVYDISAPQTPQLACAGPTGLNGHAWQKVGDLFYRQYWNPEIANPPPAGVSQFIDLADPCARTPWTATIPGFPHLSAVWGGLWMDSFPFAHTSNGIYDARVGWWPPLSTRNLFAEAGINSGNRFRLGNLLFLTPGDGQNGVAVFDIGEPAAPVLLDVLTGPVHQYTTAWQVWGHHLVLMHGDNLNGPGGDANALVIDFSDPTDLRIAWTIPYEQLPGRYVHFQDQYAFAGRFDRGVKYNMATREVERVFTNAQPQFSDFQWIPLGHLLLVSGSETNGSRSFLFTHQDGLDTTPPRLAYHLPADGATGQPVTGAVGLVIHERLDATTVNDQTIQLRPLGGAPLPAVVVHTSYDVINLVPLQPLAADTTYEVRLVAGGVRDIAGNGIEATSFFFSTGTTLAAPQIDALSNAPASPVRVGQPVTLSVQASGASEYRFDPGDGSGPTAWSSATEHLHAFAGPGVFTWQVQARGPGGAVASATRRLVVEPQPAAGVVAVSSSIVVDGAGARVWSVNPDDGSVAVFDAAAPARLAVHAACDDPRSLARAAGRTWIACRGDDRLVALDDAGAVVAELPTGRGSAPSALLVDAGSATGYAALAGSGELLRFGTANAAETGRIALGFEARALALAGGVLYAARMHSADDAGRIARIALPGFAVAGEVALPLDSDTADSGTAARGLPNYVAALAVSPDQQRLWYAAKKDNVLRGVARDGAELSFETSVRVLVGGIDAAAAQELAAARIDLDDSALALALAAAPGGAQLFVALAGNDRVLLLDPWRGAELARADTGAAPRGLAVDAGRGRLWVRNDLGRSVSVFDAAVLLAQGVGELQPVATLASTDDEPLPPAVLAGKRLFQQASDPRIGADGYLACASCHLDGGSDGRVWDFTQRGEGLRRSTTLAGRGGMAHGPLHWSANFDEVQDFEHDIREQFAGTGLLADAHWFAGTVSEPLGDPKAGLSSELDALAAYLESLDSVGRSPHRLPDGSLAAAAVQGRVLFATLGCSGCHGGAAFTDSAALRLHDVGTLGPDSGGRLGAELPGIDTPTLRGLWKEARFLHDGSAAGLDQVLAHPEAARHGALGGLDAAQRALLAAYLLSIDDDEPAAAEPHRLLLAGPAPGQPIQPGVALTLAVDADFPGIARVDYLVDGQPVASAFAPPWQAQWTPPAVPGRTLQLRVQHGDGTVTTSWPWRLLIDTGEVFADGFEAPER